MQQGLELDKQGPPKFIFSAGFVGREQEDVYLNTSRLIRAKMKCQGRQKVGTHRRRQAKMTLITALREMLGRLQVRRVESR